MLTSQNLLLSAKVDGPLVWPANFTISTWRYSESNVGARILMCRAALADCHTLHPASSGLSSSIHREIKGSIIQLKSLYFILETEALLFG